FQAEDGIRDKLVTGVQTCALPISRFNESDALWHKVTERDSSLIWHARFLFESAAHELDAPTRGLARAWGSCRLHRLVRGEWPGEIGRASCRERVAIAGCGVARKSK